MDANVTNEENGKAKKIVDFKVHQMNAIFCDNMKTSSIAKK
jgi:hypothetical protein